MQGRAWMCVCVCVLCLDSEQWEAFLLCVISAIFVSLISLLSGVPFFCMSMCLCLCLCLYPPHACSIRSCGGKQWNVTWSVNKNAAPKPESRLINRDLFWMLMRLTGALFPFSQTLCTTTCTFVWYYSVILQASRWISRGLDKLSQTTFGINHSQAASKGPRSSARWGCPVSSLVRRCQCDLTGGQKICLITGRGL